MKQKRNKIEHKTFDFEVRETKEVERDGQKFGIIKGLLATFGGDTFDRGGDTFEFGAFTDSINEHKARNNRPIRMFFQHDRKQPIGGFPIEKAKQVPEGLLVEGEVNLLKGHKGEWIYSLAKQGVITDVSVGLTVENSRTDENGFRTITRATIWEGSMVDEPMDVAAQIEVKALNIEDIQGIKTKRDFEKALRESGAFSRDAAVKMASNFKEINQGEPGIIPEEKVTNNDMSQEQSTRISELIKSFKEQS